MNEEAIFSVHTDTSFVIISTSAPDPYILVIIFLRPENVKLPATVVSTEQLHLTHMFSNLPSTYKGNHCLLRSVNIKINIESELYSLESVEWFCAIFLLAPNLDLGKLEPKMQMLQLCNHCLC